MVCLFLDLSKYNYCAMMCIFLSKKFAYVKILSYFCSRFSSEVARQCEFATRIEAARTSSSPMKTRVLSSVFNEKFE